MQAYSRRKFDFDADLLYSYLQDLRKIESDGSFIIEHFKDLFIDGEGYPDPDAQACVYRLVNSEWAEREFCYVLNRCCYIFINHWWRQTGGLLQPELEFKKATHDLVALFQEPSQIPASFQVVEKLRNLVDKFTRSPQYETLQRYARIAGQSFQESNTSGDGSESQAEKIQLCNLVHRYPCLYRFYVQDTTTNSLGYKAVSQWQLHQEQRFENDLYAFAATQLFTPDSGSHHADSSPVANPTLLSDSHLQNAIRQFVGGSDDALSSHRKAAAQFAKQIKQARHLRRAKDELHEYLAEALLDTVSSGSKFRDRFQDWLHQRLREILSQQDHHKTRDSMLLQTCEQLIEMLVASPDIEQPQKHGFFISLHGNVGATTTITLLLKLLLLCDNLFQGAKEVVDMMKLRVSRQFAGLFRHYEHQFREDAQWLTECLDNLTVALAIHFGTEGYSRWVDLL